MNLRSYLRGAGLGIIVTAIVLTFSGTGKGNTLTDDEIKAKARALGMTEGNEVLTDVFTEAEAPEIAPVQDTEPVISEPSKEAEPLRDAAPSEVSPSETAAASEEVTASSETEAPSEEAEASSETATPSEETEASSETATPSEEAEASSETAASSEKGSSRVDQMIEEALAENKEANITSEVTGEDKKKSELLADAAETAEESVTGVVGTGAGFASIHVSSGSTSTAVAKALQDAGAIPNAAAFDAFLCMKGYDRHIATGEFRIPAGSSDEDIALILMRRK